MPAAKPRLSLPAKIAIGCIALPIGLFFLFMVVTIVAYAIFGPAEPQETAAVSPPNLPPASIEEPSPAAVANPLIPMAISLTVSTEQVGENIIVKGATNDLVAESVYITLRDPLARENQYLLTDSAVIRPDGTYATGEIDARPLLPGVYLLTASIGHMLPGGPLPYQVRPADASVKIEQDDTAVSATTGSLLTSGRDDPQGQQLARARRELEFYRDLLDEARQLRTKMAAAWDDGFYIQRGQREANFTLYFQRKRKALDARIEDIPDKSFYGDFSQLSIRLLQLFMKLLHPADELAYEEADSMLRDSIDQTEQMVEGFARSIGQYQRLTQKQPE